MAFFRRFLGRGKERSGWAETPISEMVRAYNPVLYLGSQRSTFEEVDRGGVIDGFEKLGFTICELTPGMAQITPRAQDLGFMANPDLVDEIKRTEILGSIPGIERPTEYTFTEVLRLSGPFVAKDLRDDRGESVYYLEGRENIAKFIAWSFAFTIPDTLNRKKLWKRSRRIIAASEATRKGNWDWNGFASMKPEDGWVFQEYIETPSKFYTSFRILADGYGNIHYGTLIRSPQEKRVRRLHDPRPKEDFNPAYAYLRKPGSPLYIDAPHIVSNTAQGGIPIQLNGGKAADPTDREVLIAHNIDPKNPQIPKSIVKKARLIANAMGYAIPYTGIDFIYNQGLQDRFLEANFFPTLSAQGLGISDMEIEQRVQNPGNRDEVQTYLQKVLVRRIVDKTFR
ncbi:hypothetical protein M1146_02335 [Patescibacteria group bacterium]|nr:hypothetical protein [Patescibacteria group bacterium]